MGRAVGFALGFGLPVAALAFLIRAQVSPVVHVDELAIAAATDVTRANPALRSVLLIWQAAFEARWVNLVVTGACVWVWRRHGLASRALWAFITLMVSWNLGLLVKLLVRRARPVVEDAVAHAPGYSFPSGHATNTASAGLIFVLLVWPLLGPRGRIAVPGAVAAAVVVTGLDRVYLGAHYPSDVVAGVALGCAMAGASYLGFVGRRPSTTVHDLEGN
ncbi:phosphatase PAP2 family protein [Cellulomonas sp. KRMCY2]|uniref:phosphatase PAP2 family protein n=1 Tax=Cellulomonas sp. KRMCY2 TaxID=1304865 RepID=UPI00045EB8AD|nr:phosphatase PAP2 family protein [Cellulomonas sp. KRMCY2]